jgi:hypothetical protein
VDYLLDDTHYTLIVEVPLYLIVLDLLSGGCCGDYCGVGAFTSTGFG